MDTNRIIHLLPNRPTLGRTASTPTAETEQTQPNTPEGWRRKLAELCKAYTEAEDRRSQRALKSFESLLHKLASRAEILAGFDKDSFIYQTQFQELKDEFQRGTAKTYGLEKQPSYAAALNQFLDTNFKSSSKTDEPRNIILAAILLSSDSEIVSEAVDELLLTEADDDDTVATNFLNLVKSKQLSMDPAIFQSLWRTGMQAMKNNEAAADIIIHNLVKLSPGATPNDKAKALLDATLEHEESLLNDYKASWEQLSEFDDDSDGGGIALADDSSSDLEPEDKLESLKDSLVDARYFLYNLYQNADIQSITSSRNILDLLKQSSHLDFSSVGREQFNDLVEYIADDRDPKGIIELFKIDLFKGAVEIAREFAEEHPEKLSLEQIQNEAEETIIKLSQYSRFYLAELSSVLDLYAEKFPKQPKGSFLMRLARDPDTDPLLRYRVIEKIAKDPKSQSFQSLLKIELERGNTQNLATLFAIAKQKKGEYQPLKQFLTSLTYDQFSKCIQELTKVGPMKARAVLIAIDPDTEEVIPPEPATPETILSIISRQFRLDDAQDPIAQKLIRYLVESRTCKSLKESHSRIGRFIQRITSADPETPADPKPENN